ncbi:MAG TPA: GNAT family N-acetyltransferase [Chitinophagaceae bacterium]|nr:GNAT family N-acetyltransferase [Chitinophagaceae bacterium]
MNFTLRPIEANDNPVIAKIIRAVLTEFKVNKPGTVFSDPTTDRLYEVFLTEKSIYNIAELNGEIVGGCGIFPTKGLPKDTCELVKMYLLPHARGKGIGKMLIEKSLEQAQHLGYQKIYLETMPELSQALKVYEQYGFTYLSAPMGQSGHTGCQLWMIKAIKA